MGLLLGDFYIGGLGSLPGYNTMLAQAQQTAEQQMAYMRGMQHESSLSHLLGIANYRPPNPIPFEKRYADFCARLDRATSSRRPSVSV